MGIQWNAFHLQSSLRTPYRWHTPQTISCRLKSCFFGLTIRLGAQRESPSWTAKWAFYGAVYFETWLKAVVVLWNCFLWELYEIQNMKWIAWNESHQARLAVCAPAIVAFSHSEKFIIACSWSPMIADSKIRFAMRRDMQSDDLIDRSGWKESAFWLFSPAKLVRLSWLSLSSLLSIRIFLSLTSCFFDGDAVANHAAPFQHQKCLCFSLRVPQPI